ncbi:O-antigen ligase family protein [Clostridium aestuarii]|uniref:O-antigen ligase family protein n=1 Tax=Clostridium aestuarii TaxID=338193 RepID=A0ABT4CZU1_9CLOT|nr:O-antigen ligase family protein [Clostridium aestuarii]MCY6484501.1 O-antigen ligase family protein [Clostridium aestuarii]
MDIQENNQKWYSVLPLAFLVSIVPLIVYLKVVKLQGAAKVYWKGPSKSADLFSYYKMETILILSSIALLIMIIKLFKKEIEFKKNIIYIPMGIYGFFIVLSTILSEYKSISVLGFVERYEGMLILLAYICIMIAAINVLNTKKQYKVITIALLCSAIFIGIIGVLQYFGNDPFKTDFVKKLILPSKYENAKMNFYLGENVIYATMYHYNYVGSYMAMLFPFTMTLSLLIKDKKYKIPMIIVTALMFINWIGCNSRAGVIGGVFALVMMIILLRKVLIKNWKIVLGSLAVVVIIIFGMNKASDGRLVSRLSSIVSDAGDLSKAKGSYLKDVEIKDGKVYVYTSKERLSFNLVNEKIEFKDENDKKIDTKITSNGKLVFNDDRYKEYVGQVGKTYTSSGEETVLTLIKAHTHLKFALKDNEAKFINHKKQEVDLKKVEKFGFEGKEKIGSARGYIWSRSIPLLKKTMFIGNGPDTFAIFFPQDDYVGKVIAYGTDNMLVDKAHSLYLQTGINTGVISLIALLAMFLIYFVSSIKTYFKNEFNDFYSVLGLAVFLACCGYIVAGIFNDSVVSVAPVFWVLLGMGISINLKLKKQRSGRIE